MICGTVSRTELARTPLNSQRFETQPSLDYVSGSDRDLENEAATTFAHVADAARGPRNEACQLKKPELEKIGQASFKPSMVTMAGN